MEVNSLNKEVFQKLAEQHESVFSLGSTTDGLACINVHQVDYTPLGGREGREESGREREGERRESEGSQMEVEGRKLKSKNVRERR